MGVVSLTESWMAACILMCVGIGRLPSSGNSSGRGLLRLPRCGAHEIFMTHKDGEFRPFCVRFLGQSSI